VVIDLKAGVENDDRPMTRKAPNDRIREFPILGRGWKRRAKVKADRYELLRQWQFGIEQTGIRKRRVVRMARQNADRRLFIPVATEQVVHDRRMKNVRVASAEALSDAVDHHSVELTNVELLLLAGVAHAVADATAIFVSAHKFEHVNEA